jgi:hypothetical protein
LRFVIVDIADGCLAVAEEQRFLLIEIRPLRQAAAHLPMTPDLVKRGLA